ncbi:MAG: hypothetical protein NVSMB52_18390 [Chloroflexota bacterium]
MNIYEQLQAVKSDLEQQGARAKTIRIMDSMITRAEGQRDSGLSFTRLQVLRRVMQLPEVLNDEDVRLDLIGLEGDLEDAAAQRQAAGPAYEPEDRRPKLKKFYKKK